MIARYFDTYRIVVNVPLPLPHTSACMVCNLRFVDNAIYVAFLGNEIVRFAIAPDLVKGARLGSLRRMQDYVVGIRSLGSPLVIRAIAIAYFELACRMCRISQKIVGKALNCGKPSPEEISSRAQGVVSSLP